MINKKDKDILPVKRILFALIVPLIACFSCGVEEFLPPDFLRPVSDVKAYPRNGAITLVFKSENFETKFDGFHVYLSTSSSLAGQLLSPIKNNNTTPTYISSASSISGNPEVQFTINQDSDGNTLQNGITYFLAVKAHNFDYFESEFSMEVYTTPRVESVTQQTISLSNGYSLQNNSYNQPWDFQTVEWAGNVHMISSLCQMKDEGYYDEPMLFNRVTDGGFATVGTYIRVYEKHLYILKTSENRFAKVYIDSVDSNSIHFRWAYQALAGNKDI